MKQLITLDEYAELHQNTCRNIADMVNDHHIARFQTAFTFDDLLSETIQKTVEEFIQRYPSSAERSTYKPIVESALQPFIKHINMQLAPTNTCLVLDTSPTKQGLFYTKIGLYSAEYAYHDVSYTDVLMPQPKSPLWSLLKVRGLRTRNMTSDPRIRGIALLQAADENTPHCPLVTDIKQLKSTMPIITASLNTLYDELAQASLIALPELLNHDALLEHMTNGM